MSGQSAFWAFSLTFYARPGVAKACVDLQDRCGIDVNCLFLILFLSSRGRLVDATIAAKMHSATQEWRERVVMPLRGVRRHLKALSANAATAGVSALRSDVKRVELEAERLQQIMLETLFPPETTGCAAAPGDALQANLELFERHAGGLATEPFLHIRDMALAELEARQ